MDRDRADADRVLESLTNAFGRSVIPLELPIGKEKNFRGVVDLVTMKAYTYELGGNGKGKETEIPADMKDEVQAQHEKLVELVAEGNDALLEEFFEKGTIPEEDLIPALHNAIREDKIFPVIFGSGLGNIGADRVMDFIVDYTPAPSEHEWVQGDPASVQRNRASLHGGTKPMPSRCRSMSSRQSPIPSRDGFPISKSSQAS